MHSYDITAALAVERTNTLLAEAANARLAKAARADSKRAASRVTAGKSPFRPWRLATA